MHDVQMYAGAISVLLFGVSVCLGDISLAKAREYLTVHMHKPYNNLHWYTRVIISCMCN